MVQAQCSSFSVAEPDAVAASNQQERSCSEVYVGTDDQTKRSTELLGEKYQRRAYSYSNNRRSQFAAAQQTPQQSSTTSLLLKSFLNATADKRDEGEAETWFASRDLALSRSSFDNHSAVPAIASSDSLGLFNFTPSCSREDDEFKVDEEDVVVERQDDEEEEEEAQVYNQDHEYYNASQSKALFHQQQAHHPSVVQVTSPHPPKTTSTTVKGILKSPTCVRTNITSTEKSITTTAAASTNTPTATFLNLSDFFCWK